MRRMNRAVDADHADPATVAREFLAALAQRSLKISRRDAEDLSQRSLTDLSQRRRGPLQGSLAENAEIAGLVCFCSLALSARDLPRFPHEFSASLREMLSVSARDPPPRTCDGCIARSRPITQTPRPSPGKFPRRSLAEIAEDLSRDAEDLSRRRRES